METSFLYVYSLNMMINLYNLYKNIKKLTDQTDAC